LDEDESLESLLGSELEESPLRGDLALGGRRRRPLQHAPTLVPPVPPESGEPLAHSMPVTSAKLTRKIRKVPAAASDGPLAVFGPTSAALGR